MVFLDMKGVQQMKLKPSRKARLPKDDGPGLLFILVALAAVALVSARFFGFTPGDILTSADRTPPSSLAPAATSPVETGLPVARTEPRVLIYHAHASENYSPNPTHARPGTAGDIVEVGRALAEYLEARGIRTIHMPGVYDQPWSQAYQQSRRAVTEVLSQNPSIQVILDIHRDAIESTSQGVTTVLVRGDDAAKVLLAVGETENPNAASNAAFANLLRDELERRYPGITRGVRMVRQAVNGDLHPQLVQLHVGDYTDNTVEEAKRTIQHVGDALIAVLAEM